MKKEDVDKLGMGVLLQMMGGNEETVKAHEGAIGKTITEIDFDETRIVLLFSDKTGIDLRDDGQSCCEHRYMTTDDDLQAFVGSEFRGAEIKDAPGVEDEYGDHEVQFLVINTSSGAFTVETHNEHNGYYGGFWIVIKTLAVN